MANRLPGSGEVTRLTLLSLLSAGPSHGYGLRAQMESWRMDAWANIRYGSIYQVLGRMEAEGLVKVVSHGADGRRPARSTYAITEAGREELHRLLRAAWATPTLEVQPVNVALSMVGMGLLPAEEIEECLVKRLAALEQGAAEIKAEEQRSLALCAGYPGAAQVLADHFNHFHRLVEAERAWAAQVLEHVRDGSYQSGEPAGFQRGVAGSPSTGQ
jgi:DNA-binding PadR family transcriptional regulator